MLLEADGRLKPSASTGEVMRSTSLQTKILERGVAMRGIHVKVMRILSLVACSDNGIARSARRISHDPVAISD